MSNIFHWDELEIIRKDAEILFGGSTKPDKKQLSEWCDYLEYVLCLVYAYGWHDAEEIVGIVPFEGGRDIETVDKEIEGKTFRERIIDTESHRDYNTAVYEAAKESGISGLKKTWNTMLDDKVRESHRFIEGVSVGLEDLFYTDNDDSALFPGGFSLPENNINCRCFVTLER